MYEQGPPDDMYDDDEAGVPMYCRNHLKYGGRCKMSYWSPSKESSILRGLQASLL
jgi:hypothetical protein